MLSDATTETPRRLRYPNLKRTERAITRRDKRRSMSETMEKILKKTYVLRALLLSLLSYLPLLGSEGGVSGDGVYTSFAIAVYDLFMMYVPSGI